MLDQSLLETQIKSAVKNSMQCGITTLINNLLPAKSTNGNEMILETAEQVSDVIAESLSVQLAAAIDSYVRNISIFGTVSTVGTPVSQTAIIFSSPTPSSNGVTPNTLGIT